MEQEKNEDQLPIGEKKKSPLDIMKEFHKSKLSYFSRKELGQDTKTLFVGVKKDICFKEYGCTKKSQNAMTFLKEDALVWWVNEEGKLHVIPLQVN